MGTVHPFRRRSLNLTQAKPLTLPADTRLTTHLMTQRDQPYGSERRCCEICGQMLVGTDLTYTDDEMHFYNLPPQYRRCNQREEWD